MTKQEREEIKRLAQGIEDCAAAFDPMGKTDKENGVVFAQALLPLAAFARQQLNLRVDGDKLLEKIKPLADWFLSEDDQKTPEVVWDSLANVKLEAIVFECLTTDPLPTES